MSIDWATLRPWNGSKNHAFKELCAQLASSENAPPGVQFIRKRTPDDGVECFWQLANDDVKMEIACPSSHLRMATLLSFKLMNVIKLVKRKNG